jgi:hypothetical protein
MSYPYYNQHFACTQICTTNLDRLSPQNEEGFRSLSQESCELVNQNMLNLICLLDLDAYAYTVYAWFNQHSFILVASNG